MRVIILGPPNSGKSTFLASLEAEVRALGGQVTRVELDLAAPTAELIDQGASAETFRNRPKRTWSVELAEEAAQRFQSASGSLIVGDAPGQIDTFTEILAQPADAAIILIREDMLDSLEEWRQFADRMSLDIVAEIVSVREGVSQVDPDAIPVSGLVAGLERKVLVGDVTVRGVAEHVLELRQEVQNRDAQG